MMYISICVHRNEKQRICFSHSDTSVLKLLNFMSDITKVVREVTA